jgi:hypothetical protein
MTLTSSRRWKKTNTSTRFASSSGGICRSLGKRVSGRQVSYRLRPYGYEPCFPGPFLSPRVSIEGPPPWALASNIWLKNTFFSLKTHDADKTLFFLEIEGRGAGDLPICHATIVIAIVIVIIDTDDQGKFPPS